MDTKIGRAVFSAVAELLVQKGTAETMKEMVVLWSCHAQTRRQPGERDNARENARLSWQRKASDDVNWLHQRMARYLSGRDNQEVGGAKRIEIVC